MSLSSFFYHVTAVLQCKALRSLSKEFVHETALSDTKCGGICLLYSSITGRSGRNGRRRDGVLRASEGPPINCNVYFVNSYSLFRTSVYIKIAMKLPREQYSVPGKIDPIGSHNTLFREKGFIKEIILFLKL